MIRYHRLSLVCIALLLFCNTSHLFSQSSNQHQFLDIAYIKSSSKDFVSFEKKYWVPIHKQLIKDGKKAAWLLYQVRYPGGSKNDYDYVRLNILTDWQHVENPYEGLDEVIKKVHPGLDLKKFSYETNDGRILVYTRLFQLMGQAGDNSKEPSKFIIVNEMMALPDTEGDYVNLELTYFKSFHEQRILESNMNYWGLYKTAIPYGSKYEYNYVTLNGFMTWEYITKSPPPSTWEKVHGSINYDKIHDEILEKRTTVNNELWELVAFAVE